MPRRYQAIAGTFVPGRPQAGALVTRVTSKKGISLREVEDLLAEVKRDHPGKRLSISAQLPKYIGIARGKNRTESGWFSTPFSTHDNGIRWSNFIGYEDDDDVSEMEFAFKGQALYRPRAVNIVIVDGLPAAGGAICQNGSNDCLFNALKRAGHLPPPGKVREDGRQFPMSGPEVRAALGFEPKTPVQLRDIPKVEELFGVRINVDRVITADISTADWSRPSVTIRLIPRNDRSVAHYTPALNEERGHIHPEPAGWATAPRDIQVWAKSWTPGRYNIVGRKCGVLDVDGETKGRYIGAAKAGTAWVCMWRIPGTPTVEELKAELTRLEAMDSAVNKRCNLRPSDEPEGSIAKFSVRLWKSMLAAPVPMLLGLECAFVARAMTGALIWCRERDVVVHDALAVDVTSLYPAVMKSVAFPDGLPEFVNGATATAGAALPIGIYTVRITREELEKEQPPRFRWNARGLYTHFDVLQMRKAGYEHSVEGPALIWRSSTKELFREFVETTFQWKRQDPSMKPIVTTLWGALGERNWVNRPSATVPLYIDGLDWKGDPSAEDCQATVRGSDLSKPLYKLAPHLALFTIAAGRLLVNKKIDALGRDRVMVVQTDGAILNMDVEGPELAKPNGGALGGLKHEARGRCEIAHVNKHRITDGSGQVIKTCGRFPA